MFKFSNDEFIASKQREQSLTLLEELMKSSILEHSPEIENFFDTHVRTYEILEELPNLGRQQKQPIIMVCIPWNASEWHAKMDLEEAYEKLKKSWKDTIPFIEFSFPSDYNCKHGQDYKHVYIFFFSKFNTLEGSRDCFLYYLNKLNNLKAFL